MRSDAGRIPIKPAHNKSGIISLIIHNLGRHAGNWFWGTCPRWRLMHKGMQFNGAIRIAWKQRHMPVNSNPSPSATTFCAPHGLIPGLYRLIESKLTGTPYISYNIGDAFIVHLLLLLLLAGLSCRVEHRGMSAQTPLSPRHLEQILTSPQARGNCSLARARSLTC